MTALLFILASFGFFLIFLTITGIPDWLEYHPVTPTTVIEIIACVAGALICSGLFTIW